MNVGVGMFIFSCCFINSAFRLLRRKVLHRFFVEGHLGKVHLGRREGTGLRVSQILVLLTVSPHESKNLSMSAQKCMVSESQVARWCSPME
jgi:hypothetical protein